MSPRTPSDDELVAALCAALAPYPWRCFTPGLLARFVRAVCDREALAAALGQVPGAAVGTWEQLEPAERTDTRVPRLVDLSDWHRPGLSLLGMCRHLLAALDPGPG